MMYRGKHVFLQTGYHIGSDCRYGLTVGLGHRDLTPENQYGPRYRLIISFVFDRPVAWWRQEAYAINEPGYVKGIPVGRLGIPSSTWTGRDQFLGGWYWPHFFAWSFRRD